MENKEIECRFLEIDKEALIKKLHELGAVDEGEKLLEEIIVYDKDLKWRDDAKFVKIRKAGDKITVTYKQNKEHTIDSTVEIELVVDSFKNAELFLENIGLVLYRHQQKKRHTFQYKDVTVDIDTWPRVPTYVELEGPSEKAIKDVAKDLGFDWKDMTTKPPRWVIENNYNIPIGKMRWFTFDRFE